MSGLEALPWIKKYQPNAKTIVLSQSDSEDDIYTAIQLGAAGYHLKSSDIGDIGRCVHTVLEKGASLDPKVASLILKNLSKPNTEKSPVKALSARELEILHLISDGLSKKEIAAKLGISVNTVIRHIVHIYEKLEVSNAASAVSRAYRSGIL